MTAQSLFRFVILLVFSIGSLALVGYYWYMSWFRPEQLVDMISGYIRRYPPWWPFRKSMEAWIGSIAYIWFVRITMTTILLAAVGFGVVAAWGFATNAL